VVGLETGGGEGGSAAGLMLAGVFGGALTVGLPVGIVGCEPVPVLVSRTWVIDAASAPTAGELAKLVRWCFADGGGLIVYLLEMTGTRCAVEA
jgi:hypothetical protein